MSRLVLFIFTNLLRHRSLSATTSELLEFKVKLVQPPRDKIQALLRNEIESYDRVYLVLDALDESPGDLSTQICRFALSLPGNTRILCTSRRIPTIMKTFSGDQVHILDLATQKKPRDDDVRMYVDSFFSDDEDSAHSLRDLVERTNNLNRAIITSKVLDRACGM